MGIMVVFGVVVGFSFGVLLGYLLWGKSGQRVNRLPEIPADQPNLYDEVTLPAGAYIQTTTDGKRRTIVLVDPHPGAPKYERN